MQLVTFHHPALGEGARLGVLNRAGEVVDLGPGDMQALVSDWGRRESDVRAAAAGAGLPVADVRLLAPIRPRNNVMCVGKNYREHAKEFAGSGFDASQRQVVPDAPVIFTKALSSLAGPDDEVDVSADRTGTSDYEGELAVVIGRGGRGISAASAMEHVFGYTIVNDVTVRELQRRHVQFFVGKSAATYCPMGPTILTRDEVEDPAALWVRTSVNGEERQAAPVADLIFSIPTLIEAISASVLLEAGDVIATGTPAGVGIGFDPPVYLRTGDLVEVSIDGIGTLRNTCV